jgi:hypothetical protein
MRLRAALFAALAASSLVVAGCMGSPGQPTATASQTQTTQPTTQTTAPTTRTTVPPSTLSDSEAESRALRTEERHLTERLRAADCLGEWGTAGATMAERATVENRTSDGVVVAVRHPYSYSKAGSHADLASNARYLVTENETERRSGTNVQPC